jgi:hypothetical protein
MIITINFYIVLKCFEESKLKENFSTPKVDARLLGKAKEKSTKNSRRSQKKSRRGTKKNTIRK